jgi:amino acid adenylation domain-containing protein
VSRSPRSAPGPDGRPTNPFEPFDRAELERAIGARFERQADRGPDRLAVKMGAEALGYGALDAAANRVAHVLLDRLGAGNDPVALLLPQGPGQVAGVLGALKAGKIYVPLDPSQPAARLVEAIADSAARLVLTAAAHRDLARRVAPDRDAIEIETTAAAPDRRPGLAVSPDAGAYIFYTSGSTGRPKGVLDTHRNVLHNVMRYTNTLHLGPGDRLTLLQGPSFSGAVSSLFGALLNGAASFPFDVPREGANRIAAWLAAEAITVYHSVPALFREVVAHGATLPALRIVRLEGDQASVRDLEAFRRHFPPDCVLVNGLGATECGLVRQFFFTPGHPLPERVAPIGEPVEDMEIVLLGEGGSPAPEGEVGEIAVRSRYLAAGYWRRPELTAERFLDDPERPGLRLYRTGDVGRFQPGGLLEHLGRVDGLAKIRGQRVEAALVESALLTVPGVAAAAVTVREDVPGEARLIAYLVPGAPALPSPTELREALAGRLPDFMVPSAFVPLDRLPLNDNGKVDRRALPPPPPASGHRATAVAPPRDAIEYTLTGIWEDVLGVRPVGIRDDFFDLGGHSLLAARMAEAVERVSGRPVPLTTLFEAPTIERLARVLRSDECRPGPPLVALNAGGTRPPLFFLHGDIAGGGFYSRALARALGPEQPVYAVHPHGLGGEPVPASIEAMAEDRLPALRAARPEGPYVLGGYCDGALVALELARRLAARGATVPIVVLLDALGPPRALRLLARAASAVDGLRGVPAARARERLVRWREREEVARARLRYYRGRLRELGRADLEQRAVLVGRLIGRRLAAWNGGPRAAAPAERAAPLVPDLTARYRRAVRAYLPAPYPGRLVVLRSEHLEDGRPDLGWSQVSRHVEVHALPGDHLGCITRHVDATAGRLGACLEALARG